MSINKNFKLPETDLYMDDKGNVVSLVELLGGKELAIESGHHTYKTPNTSMVIDSDGNLYNLVDVIKNAVDNRSQDQNGQGGIKDSDKVDYMGEQHESLKETNDANVEYVLGEVHTTHYEGQRITATDTIARQVKNAELKGQTLVNVHQQTLGRYTLNCTRQYAQYNVEVVKNPMMSPGKTYLYILDVIENTANSTATWNNNHNTLTNEWYMIQAGKTGRMVFKAKFKENANNPWRYNWFEFNEKLDNYTGHIVFTLAIIPYQDGMENWDIPYFEGMQSVKSPVLTTTEKNLFNYKSIVNTNKGVTITFNNSQIDCSGTYTSSNLWTTHSLSTPIKLRKGDYYYSIFGIEQETVYFTTSDGEKVYTGRWTFNTDIELVSIHFGLTKDKNYDGVTFKIQIEEGNAATSYEPHKTNILSIDGEYRGIGDVCDTADLISGEKVERIGEMILNGSDDEKWIMPTAQQGNNTYLMYIRLSDAKPEQGKLTVIDKIPYLPTAGDLWLPTTDVETYRINHNRDLLIRWNKARFSKAINSVSDFKEYLQVNPIIVQYALNESIIKTVDLQNQKIYSYDGTTHYTCSAAEGSLVPTLSIDVPTNLPALVSRQRVTIESQKEQIITLEQENEQLIAQNEVQDTDIALNQDAINFMLFTPTAESLNEGNEEVNVMANYLANQIRKGRLDYTLVISRYGGFKKDIDTILINEGKQDLIK